jgi:hypothetical protein
MNYEPVVSVARGRKDWALIIDDYVWGTSA